jgi:ABC-2 type transport system ATP-binding protein
MTGASYAGGIELVSAGIDHRIDAIAPSIAWHSLLTALCREDLVKGGWAAALSGLGIATATALGVISPAGVQTGTVDPHITSALTEGLATGHLSAEDRAWFESRGPGARYTLQVVGGSSVYGPVRSAGTVALKAIRLSMPSVRR